MKPVLTPRELAQAIAVSESSVKRWVDDGTIAANRTAGGHRRIPIAEAVRYIRDSESLLTRPELLGLSDVASVAESFPASGEEATALFDHLIEGRSEEVKGLIVSLYLGGSSVAQVVDGPLRDAMEKIGALWEHRPEGIFFEHRATAIAINSIARLRTLLSTHGGGPLAVGGAAPQDHHLLPTLCAATVLEAAGLEAVNLGANLPVESLRIAIDQLSPSLIWMSVSTDTVSSALGGQLRDLARELRDERIPVVVGGPAIRELGLRSRDNLRVCSSMAELEAIAHGILFAGGAST